jgi:transcriptional regulator with XRE-family HTH domain
MPQVSVNSIGEYIREQREQAKISLRQLSQAAGVSNPYLSQIERGLRKPSAEILQQIAKGLRISAEALYVQAGILEDRPADSGVRSALLADPTLSERQKQVLVEIYESFRKEGGTAADVPVSHDAAISLMPRAVTAADPALRPDDRPARRGRSARSTRSARGASSGTWAAATDDAAGLDEVPDEPQSPASAAGTGWPADVPPHTGE